MFRELMFNLRFESKKHVNEYVMLVDSLIQQAKEQVFPSEADIQRSVESEACPIVTTSNDIRIMYSIADSPEGFRHHLSISRSPHYLASLYAKRFAALFCSLSGLTNPGVLYRSEQAVYHAGWILDGVEQRRFEAYENPSRLDPKALFSRTLMDSMAIQVEPIDNTPSI
jgi:hypothetical protein